MDKTNNIRQFEKGKTVVVKIQDTYVRITFAAQKNETIAETIKSTLLNAYLTKIC